MKAESGYEISSGVKRFGISLQRARSGVHFKHLLIAGVVAVVFIQSAAGQSFGVRNAKNLVWPKADAEKIYRFASTLVENEFKPRSPVHPQFTLVLGYEKDQMDVNTNELRLRKWDRRMFTEGVILFGFEQMMPASMKTKLVERTLKESDSVLTIDEARESSCGNACNQNGSSSR